jgi:hypothetical protein
MSLRLYSPSTNILKAALVKFMLTYSNASGLTIVTVIGFLTFFLFISLLTPLYKNITT